MILSFILTSSTVPISELLIETIASAMFCFNLGEYTAEVILPTCWLSFKISQKVVLGPVKGSQSKITPTCFLLMPSWFI